jgi:hypothetical protein
MVSRRTENVTRVDVRIPNQLYEEISAIAIHHFNAKIHHRSNKPEVTPTILENKLSGVNVTASCAESKTTGDEKILSDMELSEL